jgi:hypothetical protein
MSEPIKKPVTRIFTTNEARYLFDRFEEIHCWKEVDGKTIKCPAWDWNLEHLDDNNVAQKGGCKLRDTHKLCNTLGLAAQGHYVLEIRPKNEDDVKKEKEYERQILEMELRKLKAQRSEVEETILSIEDKMRTL